MYGKNVQIKQCLCQLIYSIIDGHSKSHVSFNQSQEFGSQYISSYISENITLTRSRLGQIAVALT